MMMQCQSSFQKEQFASKFIIIADVVVNQRIARKRLSEPIGRESKMHLNREDIKNLLLDLNFVQDERMGYPDDPQDVWRKDMIKSLEGFQKMFGWEKD